VKCTEKAIRYYDLLFTVNGTYEECLRLLKNKKPKAIVFTNDHLIIARSLLLAANKLRIKTYYVQHASVTQYFPPLEFSYALLDGEDAYLKYKQCGNINSEVKLVGISKFDSYINNVNNNKRIYNVGIAFNLVDEIESVEKTIAKIKENHPDLKLIVRPHPAEQRNLKLLNDVYISNSMRENSFDFIKKIDCLVSGDSSIHLEAVLLNVYSCYYNFNVSQRFDYYGFVKNGLIEYIENIEDLNKRLTELKVSKPDTQKKSKFYNEAIGTDYYGNSTNKISEIIIDTLKIENDKK